jgi:hypothetical protein
VEHKDILRRKPFQDRAWHSPIHCLPDIWVSQCETHTPFSDRTMCENHIKIGSVLFLDFCIFAKKETALIHLENGIKILPTSPGVDSLCP